MPMTTDYKFYILLDKLSETATRIKVLNNSIVVYSIEKSSGKLHYVETVASGGDWPREFSIDLTGNILLVANQCSNTICTFKIDTTTGKLSATGHQVAVEQPVFIQVVPAFNAEHTPC